MKILVLGGNGFIGSHLVDELLSRGHEISVFDRSAEPWRPPISEVKYFLGDFSDQALLAESLQGVDAVIHLISTTVPSTSNLDPIADIQNNLENSIRLFQLMVSTNVKRIIYFSSGGTVYGMPSVSSVPESHELNPICSYGVVKLAIEKYLGMFKHLYDLQPLIIRPSNPYGPRQGHQGVQGVMSTFMYKVLTGKKISIWGDGSVKRDYIYISDLASFCGLAIESDKEGIFNVGSDTSYTLNEIVKDIENVTQKKAVVEYTPARNFDIQEIKLDITRTKEFFHWQPTTNIKNGLSIQYEWMIKNLKQSHL